MRLLAVINNPVYGGAHNELLGQRAGLEAHEWETHALTPDEPATGLSRLRDAGVDVTPIRLHRLRASFDPRLHAGLVLGFLPELRAIRRVIRAKRIDLVQVHGPIHPHGAVAARAEGIPVCWHLYDLDTPRPLRRVLMPLVRRLADSVTTTGRAVAEGHPGCLALGERLVITSPPVDFTRFRPDGERRALARAELGIPDGALALGTVGNRIPVKGHVDLVEAVHQLASRGMATRVLGGASPAHAAYERELRRAIEARGLTDTVRLIDPGQRVDELLPAFDVFVLSSRSEGLPTVVLEAMGCGLPVVATDVGGVREIINDGVTGFVVPPRDPAALSAALARLAGDPALRARIGDAGRQRAITEFGLERVVANRVRAYEIALSLARSRRQPRSLEPSRRD